ncbi:L-glutamine synthetase [Chthonomonas calidirosea]|jgi:glutamine synthetase|uniref:Glutamine synthetase n=3 Tax=Chthonomonas TaxID=1077265 RepID=S0EZ41_CHTCT|nr:type I glutamate--ammonia ligase [Chthonomonas calidirosea]CCW35449.1 L-glutamine synthetase [Chthonomonas calidirosea T49]CEK19255.1 L-glutamine synthetase [Chthonomonas calidirosea]CEK19256.1 L-glutamine synthetase [Chthonomonas calidirosea]CEK20244.1 L-glutamine synthetase [Chthonomonas calidirosea]
MTTPKEVIEFAREREVRVVDVRFTDLFGQQQHFSIPATAFTEEVFSEGLAFDGSSIRGFKTIDESDMLLLPDPNTAFIDPFFDVVTLNIVCDIVDPITRERYNRDPRQVAHKAEAYLKSTGIADTAYFGPEAEFYIFNDVRYDQTTHSGYYFIDSDEGIWNSGRDEKPNLGYKIPYKRGYFPVPPLDSLQELRTEMMLNLIEAGIEVEMQHHEVGTAGQAEIDMRFDTLVRMADKLQTYKYIIKNTAIQNGYTVTFMPKPLFQDNGSGMHTHQSLWKDGKPLFFDEKGYGQLSELAVYYIGGILKHAASLLAFCAPTTNSYRRLVPGYEAPINLIYSARNRSACVRIPMISKSPKAKRIEFRAPDPSANPYLAFAAMMMAGLDGIENKIQPPAPIDKDLYELEPEERHGIAQTPGSLAESLQALEEDHEYLLKGGVFDQDLIETYIEYKRKQEIEQIALRPHPYEFALYYDI